MSKANKKLWEDKTQRDRHWNARNAFHKYDGQIFTLEEWVKMLKEVVSDNLHILHASVDWRDLEDLLWRENWAVELEGPKVKLDLSRQRELTRLEKIEDKYKTLTQYWGVTPWESTQFKNFGGASFIVNKNEHVIFEVLSMGFPSQEALVQLINDDIPWMLKELAKKK